MELLIALVLGVGLVGLAAKMLAGGKRGRHQFKCHDCQHRRKTFDDGVMCGYGEREVFKTRAHIAMCPDWTPAERRR